MFSVLTAKSYPLALLFSFGSRGIESTIMGSISFSEGRDLLEKLSSERIPVLAALTTSSGSEAHLRGTLDSISRERGVSILNASPASPDAGFISVRISDRPLIFSFGTERDLPLTSRDEVVQQFGNTILIISFADSMERLVLMWNS